MIEKHLYQRTVEKKGKKIKIWYFWFLHNGKQIRRSCSCQTKKEAQAYIAAINDDDLIVAKNALNKVISNKENYINDNKTIFDFEKQ